MMNLFDLWLPILVAAAVMYVASTLIWVVFKWHNADYNKLDDEGGSTDGPQAHQHVRLLSCRCVHLRVCGDAHTAG